MCPNLPLHLALKNTYYGAPVVGIEPRTFRVRAVVQPLHHTEYGEAIFRLIFGENLRYLNYSQNHWYLPVKMRKSGALGQKCEYDAHNFGARGACYFKYNPEMKNLASAQNSPA